MKATQCRARPQQEMQYQCCVCKKHIRGYYGSHAEGGTCSRRCEDAYDEQKRAEIESHFEGDTDD